MKFSLGNLKMNKKFIMFVSIFLTIGVLFFIIKKLWYSESFISSQNKVTVDNILKTQNMSYFEKIGKINESIVNDETLEDITYYGLKKLLLKIDEYIKIKKSDEFNEIKKILVMKNVSFYNKVKRIKVVNKNDVVNNIILEGENNIMKEIEIYVNAANAQN
jgi:hypothetical protein